MLSSLSSIYDPLGLAAPFILEWRRIIQSLCHQNLDWDEQIPDSMARQWLAWKSNLLLLKDIKVEIRFKPKKLSKIQEYSLYHFSDALMYHGYGQFSYLRLVDENDQIHCSLVIEKSRVVPLNYISIPWLELTAAILSVKISKHLMSELQFSITEEVFWTDSQVVLSYIKIKQDVSKLLWLIEYRQ